jgi:hypothetical protein
MLFAKGRCNSKNVMRQWDCIGRRTKHFSNRTDFIITISNVLTLKIGKAKITCNISLCCNQTHCGKLPVEKRRSKKLNQPGRRSTHFCTALIASAENQ